MPRGTPYRRLHAALHLLAADAELATPAREHWVVQTEVTSDERGRVYVEIADATEEEAERGLELLRAVIA